ncbi:MAG: hypothetical protein ACNA7W_02070 [Pseudomonadales bacterium]
MSPSLPLFLELEELDPQPDLLSEGAGQVEPADVRREPTASRRRSNDQRAAGDRHLRAAWRLARAMRRLPDRSTEQTRAGLAICAHLRAALAEAERLQRP